MAPAEKTPKPKRHREWVPSAFLIVHDQAVSCTIRFTPMHLRRNPDARYFSSLKVYGNSPIQPVWRAESGALPLHSVYNVYSAAIARDMGVERLFHYGEAFNWSPDFNPPPRDTLILRPTPLSLVPTSIESIPAPLSSDASHPTPHNNPNTTHLSVELQSVRSPNARNAVPYAESSTFASHPGDRHVAIATADRADRRQ